MVQSAIDASGPGDEVVFQGSCLIDSTIKLLGKRTYRGEHRSSSLTHAPGASGPLLASDSWVENSTTAGTPITIRDMLLQGNSGANTTGIMLRSWRSQVDNVQVRDFGRDGILLSVESQDGTPLTSTMVGGMIRDSVVEDVGRYGIANDNSSGANITDWWVLDNDINGTGSDAIHLGVSAGWTVRGNHTYGVRGDAIWANRAFSTSITDNMIEDFGVEATSGTFHGIFVNVTGGWPSTVTNNRVMNDGDRLDPQGTYRYLFAEGSSGSGRLVVSGNALLSAEVGTSRGLVYDRNYAPSFEVTSTGNQAFRFASGDDKVIVGSVTQSPGL